VREKFFENLDDPLVLGGMAWPCAHVREAELVQKLSDVALVKVDAESLRDDPLEIHPAPAHDAVFFLIRSGLDDRCEFGHLLNRQARLGPSVQLSMSPSGPAALKR
jgi:hypothetical protein